MCRCSCACIQCDCAADFVVRLPLHRNFTPTPDAGITPVDSDPVTWHYVSPFFQYELYLKELYGVSHIGPPREMVAEGQYVRIVSQEQGASLVEAALLSAKRRTARRCWAHSRGAAAIDDRTVLFCFVANKIGCVE